MPFITYKIDNNYFKDYQKINSKNLSNFNTDINDLNLKKKAILVSNDEPNTKDYLANIINKISNENLDSLSLIEKKILLEETLNNLNQSLELKIKKKDTNQINIDFNKNLDNQINRDLRIKYIEGNFYPEDFENNTDNFKKNFLGKLKIFIQSKIESNENINVINIYHKELSNYLYPNDESLFCSSLKNFKNKLNGNNLKNMRKIEYGIRLLYSWWNSLPENIKPKEFKVLTDIPQSLKKLCSGVAIKEKEIKLLQNKIEDFLFNKNQKETKKPSVKIINQRDMPGYLGWKHKRHWVLGTKINNSTLKEHVNIFAIKSDFGVEIVDENNNSRLNDAMELTILTEKNTKQMRDIVDYWLKDEKDQHL